MTATQPSPWPRLAVWILTGVLFAAAYGQAPLYYSNQNQYFLHGFADANQGTMNEDWLANTADPTPAFSVLVAFTVRYCHPWCFHALHGVVLALYAVALLAIFEKIAGAERAARRWPLFGLVFVLLHSALARWLSYRWLGQDYPWYAQAGVAGQYTLGAMLQPSLFGVFLLVAVALFLYERPAGAAFFVAAAASMHTTYLLAGACFTLGFVAALVQEKKYRVAARVSALSLVGVLPVVLHAALTFRPTSADEFAQAQDILVNVRIPHHARPDLWFDWVAGVQIGWMALGVALSWRTRLFAVLGVPLLLGALLTLVQVTTSSHSLALLFPWRVSALLVPLATTVILTRLVTFWQPEAQARQWLPYAATAACVALAAAGLWISLTRQAFHIAPEDAGVMAHVKATKKPGDVYLLPVRVPDLAASTRGSLSSDFKPLPEKRQDTKVIPIDLQGFRLHAEAPIYVDFKSIPYKDVDVLEWRARLNTAARLQDILKRGNVDEALPELRRLRITHVVVPRSQTLTHPALDRPYQDDFYRVYHIRSAAPPAD